jgi:uncharacterized cupredoxin-like copper-binding protein
MRRHPALKRAAPLTAILIVGLIAGCGDDDDSGSPTKVAIEASGAEGSLSYDTPAEVSAGAAEIAFTNSSELGELDAQLAFTPDEHSDEEVIAELRNAFRGEAVADWFQGGGGVRPTAKGETGTVTQELQPGYYYVVGGEDLPKPPVTKIEVTDDDGAELPDADATVTAEDYSFSGEGLEAGDRTLLLDNAGEQWHHFLAAPLKDGATIEDAQSFLGSEGEGDGPPPFGPEGANPVESTVLEGGTSQLVEVDLEAGRYAFFCFVSDRQGGPPHAELGMVSEITVEE